MLLKPLFNIDECVFQKRAYLKCVLIVFFVISHTSYAQQTTWYLDGITLDSGGTISGSFDFDTAQNAYSNVNVTITNSTNYGSVTFTTVSPLLVIDLNDTSVQLIPSGGGDLTGLASLFLEFSQSLTIGSGNINISIGNLSLLGGCFDNICNGVTDPIELITSGRVTSDPLPSAVCQNITVNLDSAGNASIIPTDIDGGSTDDQPGFTLSLNQTAFTCADLGPNTVTLTVTDSNGSIDSCTATVTVVDNTAPDISCSADISTNVDLGLCTASVTVPAPTTSDNCPNTTITNDFNNTSDASGNYPIGTTTVIWTITDAAGNENTCNQNITVNDAEVPSITCPADVSVPCSQIVDYSAPTTSDNCGFLEVPNSIPNTILLGTFGGSTYFVDTRDLQASVAFSTGVASGYDLVSINSPEENAFLSQQAASLGITIPLLLGYNDIDNEGTFVWQSGQPTNYENWEPGDPTGGVIDEDYVLAFNGEWFDITGIAISRIVYEIHDYSTGPVQVAGLPSGSLINSTTTNTFFSKDLAGNINTCTQTITISDTENPTISCSDDIIADVDEGLCTTTITVPIPTFSDNCSDVTITNDFNGTSDASDSYPEGLTIVTWTATDASGNSESCVQQITVNDPWPPFIACPEDITVNVDPMTCTDAMVTVPVPVASDNCLVASVINDYTNTGDASATYPVGTTTVTWTVTDDTGRTNTCEQTITVAEAPPSLSCPEDISINCPQNVNFSTATTTDDCGFPTVPLTVSGFTLLGTFGNSTYFISDTETTASVAYAMAASNNYDLLTINSSAENQQLVQLLGDTIVYIGYNDLQVEGTYVWQSGQPSFFENWAALPPQPVNVTGEEDYGVFSQGTWGMVPGTTGQAFTVLEFHDYSSGDAIQVTGEPSGALITNTTTNTFFSKDVNGNTNTCSFTITVMDVEGPVITCGADITINGDLNTCSAMVNVPTPTVTDECAFTLTNDFNNTADASGTYPTGVTTITWTATDASGNRSSCAQRITVTEITPPSITCPADINENCPGIVNYTSPTTSDNCFPVVPNAVPGFTLLGSFGNSTYFISNTSMTGPQAFAMAEANGYDLLTINSLEENDYIYQLQLGLMGNEGLLLGYNDVQSEGNFVWQSGQPNNFEFWEDSQPNDTMGDENYVVFNRELWYDTPNSVPFPVIIEFHDYSNGRPVQVAGQPSGSFFTGTTINTFFSKDAAGNTNTCSFTITISDTTAPTITCSSDISVAADANACAASVNVPIPILGDACDTNVIPSTSRVPYSFAMDRTLTDTSVTFFNRSTSMEDVTLRVSFNGDHDAPNGDENFELVGPDSTTLVNMRGVSCILTERTITIPMATWNSWITTYGSDLIFTVPANSSVNRDICALSNNYFQIDIISQGNVLVTNDYNGTSDASGNYPVGATSITWTATDLAGNSNTCVQTVTVNETEAPSLSCPVDITVSADSGLCSAVVNYNMPAVIDNCTPFTNSLQNVLNNFNANSPLVTNLIPNPFDFVMDGNNGVNGFEITDGQYFTEVDGGFDMYDGGNRIGTDLNAGPLNYSDNTIIASNTFGINGAYFTRKVQNMWLLAADLDNVNNFDITGNLGANGNGLADGFTSTITVGGIRYNLFVKRVREVLGPTFFENDPSVNHLIIIPENVNASQNFATNTDDDQHQVTGLSGSIRLYYLLFSSQNSGFIDNTTMENIATSFITNAFTTSGTILQTEGLASGSTFPVGRTTNTFVATDDSGNQNTCSFTVTVNDPLGNCNVLVSPKVYLQGSTINSTVASDGFMRDDLRTGNYVPLNTPYTDNASINSSVLNVTGADAIVDWIWVELRDANTNTVIVEGKSALLQRDGDVVALDGSSALMFGQLADNYYIAIKHRNHLGIMSGSTVALSNTTSVVDFTNGSAATFGTNAQTILGLPNGTFAMWAGDADGDGTLNFSNDGNSILSEVLFDPGNTTFSSLFTGANAYYDGDMDLNGNISFQDDLNNLLFNILFHPSNMSLSSLFSFAEQLPENSGQQQTTDPEILARRTYIEQKLQELQNQIKNN